MLLSKVEETAICSLYTVKKHPLQLESSSSLENYKYHSSHQLI